MTTERAGRFMFDWSDIHDEHSERERAVFALMEAGEAAWADFLLDAPADHLAQARIGLERTVNRNLDYLMDHSAVRAAVVDYLTGGRDKP